MRRICIHVYNIENCEIFLKVEGDKGVSLGGMHPEHTSLFCILHNSNQFVSYQRNQPVCSGCGRDEDLPRSLIHVPIGAPRLLSTWFAPQTKEICRY